MHQALAELRNGTLGPGDALDHPTTRIAAVGRLPRRSIGGGP